jgi:hypothetical protein
MSQTHTLPYLFVTITSPADGARVTGNRVTISGTAKALRETVDTAPQPLSVPDPIDPGRLPDGPIGVPLPGASDDLEDLTGQIDKVEVRVEAGSGTAQFREATGTGPSDKRFATWTISADLPAIFGQATITARVVLGSQSETTAVRVLGIRRPVLVAR